MSIKTLIIGVGNILRQDDGIGPRIIEHLDNDDLDGKATLMNGGVDGLALIDYIKDYRNAVIIDAVDMGLTAGEIMVFRPDEADLNVRWDSLSTHGFGLAEVLHLSRELGVETNIKIVGIQPKETGFGEHLSKKVSDRIDDIAWIVKDIINNYD